MTCAATLTNACIPRQASARMYVRVCTQARARVLPRLGNASRWCCATRQQATTPRPQAYTGRNNARREDAYAWMPGVEADMPVRVPGSWMNALQMCNKSGAAALQ
eukprot:238029-Chlamydomonas_euryale.AAC.10